MYAFLVSTQCCAKLTVLETNHQDIPSPRSVIHIPTLLLPHPHFTCVGLRIRRWLYTDASHNHGLHLRTLPGAIAVDSDAVLLPSRPVIGSRQHIAAWATERPVQSWRGLGQGRVGVWILLGCCHQSVCASLGVSLRCAIPVHATNRHTPLVRL